tara:strand:+ start:124 stop:441 length:318 start_codon:yes stop_codon:yes gene_type:complete
MNIYQISYVISMIGTSFGLFSRVPQVYRTYTTKSANDLSNKTLIMNITANSCFLFYAIVNEQYPIMMNSFSVVSLEGSLLYMKKKYGEMKKSSSGTNLMEMNIEE